MSTSQGSSEPGALVAGRRMYGPVVLLLLAVGGIVFFTGSRSWAHTTVVASGLPSDPVSVSGSSALPLVPALGLVVVASSLAVLAASVRVRRGVGVLVVVVALIGAFVALTSHGAEADELGRQIRASTAYTGSNVPSHQVHTLWHLVAAAAFLASAVLGGVVVSLAGAWPTMGRRYEAPGARPEASSTSDASTSDAPGELWKALDEGRDPTE